MKTLEEFSTLVAMVDAGMKNLDKISTPVQFAELQDALNKLQAEAPQSEAVIAARVRWYKFGLDSFERYFVQQVEQQVREGTTNWQEWRIADSDSKYFPPGLVMSATTLEHFLRRHYIGEQFAIIYARVESLFKRLVRAAKGSYHQHHWEWCLQDLETKLRAGRLE